MRKKITSGKSQKTWYELPGNLGLNLIANQEVMLYIIVARIKGE